MRLTGFPAALLYTLNSVVALLVAYGLHLSAGQVGAVTVIATAVLAGVAALLTRPIVISTVSAASATALAALAAFGFHLSADQIGTAVVVLSIVLGFLTHQNVSPVGGSLDRTP
jgi:hypothetical protein